MIRPPPRSTLFPYTPLFRSFRARARRELIAAACSKRHKKQNDRYFSPQDRKSTRLNSSHGYISYAVFCLKKKKDLEVDAPQSQYLVIPLTVAIRAMLFCFQQ